MLHCFFEGHDPSLCLLVDPKFRNAIELNFASIHDPSDYLAIGYFVTSLLSTSTADLLPVQLLIKRKYTDASPYYLKLLLSEISKYAAHPAVDQSCALSRKLSLMLENDNVRLLNSKEKFCAKQEAEVIADHLGTSSAISELIVRKGFIHDKLFNIAEALQKNNTLSKLCLVDDDLRVQNGSVLFEMLRVNTSLKYLDLSDNRFLSSAAHCCIFEGLRYNTTLTRLILRNSGVYVSNPDTAKSLTTMLQENKSLNHLNLSDNGEFSQRGVSCIFNGLQLNTTLTHLTISGDYMIDDPDRVRSLALMLQVNKSLTYLDLSNSMGFSKSEARCIFESLHQNVSLVSLNLSRIDLTVSNPDTAISLTTMLRVNKSLKHLDLSKNTSLSDSGACCIFKGLEHNTSLVSLNLASIGMTTKNPLEHFKALTKMLKVNKTLTQLDLSNNSSGRCENLTIISNIFQGLQQNTTLLELRINSMMITDGDAACIAQAMRCNRCLHTLHMRSPFISGEGLSCILDSLKFNTSLKVLHLSKFLGEKNKRLVRDFSHHTCDILLTTPM